jgi:hypothetical protein
MPFLGTYGSEIARANAPYTANTNIDCSIDQGNYIFSIRSGGVYHINLIVVCTYYDSADKSVQILVGSDYQTTANTEVLHNGNNDGTFRFNASRDFDGLVIRKVRLG